MSAFALMDLRLEINSVVMSGFCTSIGLPMEYEALDDTAFGDTARSRIAGLGDSTLTAEFNQDMAASATDVTLYTAHATRAPVVVKVRATTAAISATNPEYVGSYLPNQHNPFGNGVGEKATAGISWPLSDSDGIARNLT
jgi:2,3-bisphosphoglycerate-independent phosphoglycerate mutase